jgi:hypothetical protein
MKPQLTALEAVITGALILALLLGSIVTPILGEARGSANTARVARATAEMPLPDASLPRALKKSHAIRSYQKAPLSFEANQGQTDRSVRYLARGAGYQLHLTSNEAVFWLKGNEDHSRKSYVDVMRMKLLGSRSEADIAGEELLPGKVNYLLGNQPAAWRANLPTYRKVKYKNIYSGIDLLYYGTQRDLEYDFHVSPGADPSVISLGFEGVERVKIDSTTGELIVQFASGKLIRQHKPLLYQNVDGVRQSVTGRFVMRGPTQAGFEVGPYDKTRPLVIDPVLVYATYFGGETDEATSGIAVDAAGSVYVSGSFVTSPSFPITPNAFQKTQNNQNGNGEVFVTKFTPDGSGIVYSTLLGGSSSDSSTGIGLDPSGNAYVVGWTSSTDFPVRNAFQPTLKGFPNVFVSKLNATGSDLLYSSFLGGTSGFDFGSDIAVDAAGNAYITGDTTSANFPVTPGAFRTTLALPGGPGNNDGFVAKFNTNASGAASLVYSSFCDVSAPFSNSIDIDPAGNAYVAGETRVQKINASGSAAVYTFTLPDAAAGASTGLQATDIAVDSNGNAYVTGFTKSTGLTIVNGFQPAIAGGSFDGFLVKVNPAGTALVYSTYIGGQGLDVASGVAADGSGNAYVVGDTSSVDFPTRDAFQNIKLGGTALPGSDLFIAKIATNSTGANSLVYSTLYGATNFDEAASGVAIDAEGNVYTTGFAFRVILPGIIHTGRQMVAEAVALGQIGDDVQFDPFVLKLANTSTSTVRLGAEHLSISEDAGSIEVSVVRSGDVSIPADVEYATLDAMATGRSDYTAAFGTVHFAAGETSKTFRVLITNDLSSETNETFYVAIRETTPGVALVSPRVAEVTIVDNDPNESNVNPIYNREFFVRQHYLDFLNREPDTDGFNFWVERIPLSCEGQPVQNDCVEQRVNVSSAFFLSIEFLHTGYFIYRLHKASFGDLPHFVPFLRDTQSVGRDVVVGRIGWGSILEENKQQLVAEWVERDEFKAKYDSLTSAQYVDALNANTGNSLTQSERDALVAALNGGTVTRTEVLRTVAENEEFGRGEFTAAFVLMQYFGYLRRNPDPSGYQFWLNKLDQSNGDFRRAEMVKAFITSIEYRSRFGTP